MQSIRDSVLRHVRLTRSANLPIYAGDGVPQRFLRQMCAATNSNLDKTMDKVISVVKKFDKIDSSKVTETANFQKDLSMDSLDRVELVMALEEAFSLDIPDSEADKLTCCADVAKYINTQKNVKS
uniref:Acyl carrier protein n=1 Tax=Kalanchoe fedtschenkoi TaxID=63787 RepID=A0A7N0ULG1_KALFE